MYSPMYSKLYDAMRSAVSSDGYPVMYWTPLDLFGTGAQGWWFDNSDLSTLFQDAAGTTPVTGSGQPVGLQLDKSCGLVLGPEKLVNGGFLNGTSSWTVEESATTISAASGVLSIDAGGNAGGAIQAFPTVVGERYQVFADLRVGAATGITMRALSGTGAGGGGTILAESAGVSSGSFVAVRMSFVADSTTSAIYLRATNLTAYARNVTVKNIPGNHRYQTAASSRPMLRQNATTGAYYLETDGSDDWMQTAAINFTGTDKVSLFCGVRRLGGDTTEQMIVELGSGVFNSFALLHTPSSRYRFVSRGDSLFATADSGVLTAPVSSVLAGQGSISLDVATLRVNGTLVGSSAANQGTGNYGNYPAYFFRRGGTSLPFNGHEYGSICVGRLCTATEIDMVERWLARKVGVSL